MKRLLLIVLGLLSVSISVHAASFDCAKAGTPEEKMICSDAGLSKLDAELGKAYSEAMKKTPDPAALKHEQREWMKERNGCKNLPCLESAYTVRLEYLSKRLFDTTVVKPQPVVNEEEDCLAPKIDWRDYAWTLISGKGRSACEDMFAYLKSRPSDAPPPVCPEDRLPPNKDWTRPEGRDLTEAERQVLIDGLPEGYRQKPKGPVSIEWQFQNAKLLQVLSADISRDGVPENLLAYANHDYRQACKRVTRCALDDDVFDYEIAISAGSSNYYDLQPMNDEGTQVNWAHKPAGYPPMLSVGELIYYQGRPYWLEYPNWFQKTEDIINPPLPITSPYRAMFKLSEIYVGTGKKEDLNPSFKDVVAVAIDHRPESNNVCRFGYSNRKNIKQNLTKGRNKP